MIQVSDNDAAAFLLDVLTDTASGSELEGKALNEFIDRRRKLNRYFASLGYDISAMIKPWSFGPFGRDMQIMGEKLIVRQVAKCHAAPVNAALFGNSFQLLIDHLTGKAVNRNVKPVPLLSFDDELLREIRGSRRVPSRLGDQVN